MKFAVFQASRVGGRKINEDRMGYSYTREAALFLVADGMGGHPEGEVAAQLALQTMSTWFQKTAQPTLDQPEQFLIDALLASHHAILKYAIQKGMQYDTPRTTLVAVLVQNGYAVSIHCGDSRAYLVRNGALVRRTRDHTYAEYPDQGSGNKGPINRNVLFTCLGSPGKPIYDISERSYLREGDVAMLCSDGLWSAMSEDELVRGLSQRGVQEDVPDLVELALKRMGAMSDNVTALAFGWQSAEVAPADSVFDTDTLHSGLFASTVQVSLVEGDVPELDEDAINRAIAEINATIAQNHAIKP